jgi:hypothetical protein
MAIRLDEIDGIKLESETYYSTPDVSKLRGATIDDDHCVLYVNLVEAEKIFILLGRYFAKNPIMETTVE